jgi:hypothetical protein
MSVLMATFEQLIAEARLLVKYPKEYGPRPFQLDMTTLPFGEIADIMAANIVQEFGNRKVPMTLDQWNALQRIIERRISHMLYSLAFCDELPAADIKTMGGKT